MSTGKLTIRRFDPEHDAAAHFETYDFPFAPGMSVLDAVFYIYEQVDPTLGFDYCCRNSHCGLCGALINGRPGLMCREAATPELRLEPLPGLPVIRDLLVDRRDHARYTAPLRLFLERVQPYADQQTPEAVDMAGFAKFKVASRCVECFCCLAACPVFRERPQEFAGPTAFAQLARYAYDQRDESSRAVMAASAGALLCLECGLCSAACPHNVDPARCVTDFKRQLQADEQN